MPREEASSQPKEGLGQLGGGGSCDTQKPILKVLSIRDTLVFYGATKRIPEKAGLILNSKCMRCFQMAGPPVSIKEPQKCTRGEITASVTRAGLGYHRDHIAPLVSFWCLPGQPCGMWHFGRCYSVQGCLLSNSPGRVI